MEDLGEKSLDSQLWHACAGGMVQMPLVNTKVVYFPQGHAEHTLTNVDFRGCPRIPAMILCRVAGVKFLADQETDEVYAKMLLVPIGNNEHYYELDGDDGIGNNHGSDTAADKPSSFAKTLTQSDANNGGGFSVPRYCAETIFPRLDYTADPPVQNVNVKDVHGNTWRFRHIYRGTPRRHLLTTGWSTFVNQKKLVAGDSIVFLRADNGDIFVGIRRAKRGGLGGPESPSAGWNTGVDNYGGFSTFSREGENKLMRSASSRNLNGFGGDLRGMGKVSVESVMEAVSLAVRGRSFEVVYYPRASTPEFCVKATSVRAAMRIQWCSEMRFKMAFETEDSSRISWFMGTIASVQVADPVRWPNSPWRLLQVAWDEPDLLQNVKCVSPWLVEIVSTMPVIHFSQFSPPRKKLCLPQPSDISLDDQFPLPSFLGNPLGPSSPFCRLPDGITAGVQGARHAQYVGVPLMDLHHPSNKLQSGLLSSSCQQVDAYSKLSEGTTRRHRDGNDSISCLLTIGNSSQKVKKSEKSKTPKFLLFGQPILTEQQMSNGCFREDSVQPPKGKSSSGEIPFKAEFFDLDRKSLQHSLSNLLNQATPRGFTTEGIYATQLGLERSHCKIFLNCEDVGRSLDLSILGSYEELYKTLANMFGIERSALQSKVIHCDEKGASRHIGDKPFSDFVKTAKRLTIVVNSSNNTVGRMLITGLPTAKRGLDSSNQAGPLSIFA